jgi:hypothetical protein
MLTIYHESLQEYLSPDQILMVEMLVRVIQIFKEVKIEKLASRDYHYQSNTKVGAEPFRDF